MVYRGHMDEKTPKLQPRISGSHLGATPRFLEKLENQLGACPRDV
jgi:hypothetical protein